MNFHTRKLPAVVAVSLMLSANAFAADTMAAGNAMSNSMSTADEAKTKTGCPKMTASSNQMSGGMMASNSMSSGNAMSSGGNTTMATTGTKTKCKTRHSTSVHTDDSMQGNMAH